MTLALVIAYGLPIAALLYGGWKLKQTRTTRKLKASIRQERDQVEREVVADLAKRRALLKNGGVCVRHGVAGADIDYWTRDLLERKD